MSVQPPTHEEIQIDDDEVEEEEEDEEEEEEAEDEDFEDIEEVTHGRSPGRGLTLKTLVKEGVLQPGEGHMTINYLGNKFKGDLLPDGRIRSQETNKIFGTPSAWAIYCKKIVNPDKKSGCGWASVRYKGKKLDSYKNNWYRQKRLEFEREGEALDEEEMTDSDSDGPHEQEIVEFEMIGNRHPNHDMNTMVELTSFQALGRMQPFNVTMSSSAMAMMDIHAHLSTSEVVGYLAGQWDVTNHNLIVSHALPLRCRLGDGEKGRMVEQAIFSEMEKLSLSLVGWYHTHPFSPPLPSLRDIDSQLEYELKMKGSNDASYTPCIGIIVSPYVRGGGQGTTASGFWVMPPPEHKPQEYGRPMSIQFTIIQDAFIPKETLYHVRDTVKYYKDSPDSVVFSDIFQDRFSYWDKLKTAIRLCVPKDHYAPLIDYLAKLLELKNYTPEPVGPTGKVKSSVPGARHTQQDASETTTPALSSTPVSTPTSLHLRSKISPDLGPSGPHGDGDTSAAPRPSPPVIDVSPEEPKPAPGLSSPGPPQGMETPTGKGERSVSSHLELQRHDLFKIKEMQQQELKPQPPDHHHSSRASPPQYKQFHEHLYPEHKPEIASHQSFSQEQQHQHQHQHQHKHQQHQQNQYQHQHQQKPHQQQHQQNHHPHPQNQHQQQYQHQQQSQHQQQQSNQHKHQQQQQQQQQQLQQQHQHHLQHQQQQQQQKQQAQQQYGDPPQYPQTQSYHQHFQQDYQQQQTESYQSDQKCEVDEEVQEDYREPPPSYHQHHFKIPTSYHHEDHQTAPPPYPTEDVTQTREGNLGGSHLYQEQVDPWTQGLHRQTEPPPASLQQGSPREDIQPMDVDSQS